MRIFVVLLVMLTVACSPHHDAPKDVKVDANVDADDQGQDNSPAEPEVFKGGAPHKVELGGKLVVVDSKSGNADGLSLAPNISVSILDGIDSLGKAKPVNTNEYLRLFQTGELDRYRLADPSTEDTIVNLGCAQNTIKPLTLKAKFLNANDVDRVDGQNDAHTIQAHEIFICGNQLIQNTFYTLSADRIVLSGANVVIEDRKSLTQEPVRLELSTGSLELYGNNSVIAALNAGENNFASPAAIRIVSLDKVSGTGTLKVISHGRDYAKPEEKKDSRDN